MIDGWIPDYGTSDCNTLLALTAGEATASLTNHSLVAVCKGHDRIMDTGVLARRLYFRLGKNLLLWLQSTAYTWF